MSPQDSHALVGRDAEIRRLDSVLDAVTVREKRGAMLVAPPGMGKTALLRRTASRAEEQGFACATTRTPAGTPLPPQYPLGELLRKLHRSALAHGRSGAALDRLAAVAAVFEESGQSPPAVSLMVAALEEVCRAMPAALFVDDFHWAPSEGASLLVSVLRAVDAPVALVITARPRGPDEPAPTPLPESTADLWFEIIELPALDRGTVGELAAVVLGGPMLPHSIEILDEATEGNPFHVIETIRNGLAEEWLSAVGGHWVIGEGFSARPVLDSVAIRVSRLNDHELAVASVMAVLGRPTTRDEIAAVTRLSAGHVVDALAALADAGFVMPDTDGRDYRLSHPLHRTALLDAVGSIRRASIHEAVVESLRRGKASVAELAHHATRAHHRPPDVEILLRTAAEEAEAAGSPVQAAAWFEQIAETSGVELERRTALIGQARTTAQFDPAASIDLFTQAMRGAEDSERAALLAQRARADQRTGRFAEALQDLEDARPIAAPKDLFSIEAGIAVVHLLTGNRAQAEERMAALAEESVGTPNHGRAMYHLAAARAYAGDVEGLLVCSLASVEESTDPHLIRSARNNVIWGMALLGRWAEAEELMGPSITELEAAGDYGSLFPLLINAAFLHAWKGDTVKALDFAVRSEAIAERIGNPTDRLKALTTMAVALLEGGNAAGGVSLLEDVRDVAESATEAREINYTFLVMGDGYFALGDTDAASMCCARAEALLETDSLVWSEGIARLRAQIMIATGDPGGAVKHSQPWVEAPGPVLHEHARLLEVAGHAHHALGDRATGFGFVEQAHGLYDRLGAARRAGATRGWMVLNARRPVGRPRSQLPGGLTEREVQILEQVVRGKSNREIAASLVLSPATVKTHVERILSKLGASRRSELAVIALRLGLPLSSGSGVEA